MEEHEEATNYGSKKKKYFKKYLFGKVKSRENVCVDKRPLSI